MNLSSTVFKRRENATLFLRAMSVHTSLQLDTYHFRRIVQDCVRYFFYNNIRFLRSKIFNSDLFAQVLYTMEAVACSSCNAGGLAVASKHRPLNCT